MPRKGRHSPRRGFVTTTISVKLTADELEQLDTLREWKMRGDCLRELIADAARRRVSEEAAELAAAAENAPDPRQVTLDQAIERARSSEPPASLTGRSPRKTQARPTSGNTGRRRPVRLAGDARVRR